MKTYSPKPRDIERRWYVIDAQGAVLGRLASEVAKILRGKHKPIFAPHADTGDHVIVVNARGVRLTGNKEQKKFLYRHSGYPGGLRRISYARLMAERPSLAVEKAIRGMLPKNRLGRQMIKKLAVYEGPGHPHRAQKPEALQLGRLPRWEGLPKPTTPSAPPAASTTGPRARGTGTRRGATGTDTRTARTGPARRAPSSRARTTAAKEGADSPRRGKNAGRGRAAPPKAGQDGKKKAAGATTAPSGEAEKKPARRRRRTAKES